MKEVIRNSMRKYDIVIGIDPDIDRSGYVMVKTATGEVVTATDWDLAHLFGVLQADKEYCKMQGLSLVVVVEAAYLASKHNWHLEGGYTNIPIAANIGYKEA